MSNKAKRSGKVNGGEHDSTTPNKNSVYGDNADFGDTYRMPRGFSALSKLVLRDLNGTTSSPSFYLYSKDNITEFLKNPYSNEKNIRNAITYIYGVSPHFRRLIQYFAGLSDLAYVVSPYKIDTSSAKSQTIRRNFTKVQTLLSSLDIKRQFSKILTVCLREDVFYGTMFVTDGGISIKQLPSDYCAIAIIEDNVPNVSFNFSYFDTYSQYLSLYPTEFQDKYALYTKNRTGMKWQELDSPTSFAVKCNSDIWDYAIPPFAGILREIYDLEDYRQLKLTKTELENYALLVMKLGITSDGQWEMDYEKARKFWKNLDGVTPEEVGTVLSPMDITKISFEKSNTGDTDTIAEAEQNLFTAAGVSSLLFNNEKASSSALLLSIKSDQSLTYSIVKEIEGVVNRFVHSYSYGKNFRVTFLDCSPYNRSELGDQYLKACQYGLPMISYYAASQGMSQSELDGMNFLEDDVLGFVDRFKPLRSSNTQSGSDDEDAGRPQKAIGDLTDAGEISRESV